MKVIARQFIYIMEYNPNPNKTFIDKSFQLLKNINNSAKTMDQNNYN